MKTIFAVIATLALLLLASANVASAQEYWGCACDPNLQPTDFYYSTLAGSGCGVNYQLCPDQPDVYFNTSTWECWDIVGDFIGSCDYDECLSYCEF